MPGLIRVLAFSSGPAFQSFPDFFSEERPRKCSRFRPLGEGSVLLTIPVLLTQARKAGMVERRRRKQCPAEQTGESPPAMPSPAGAR
jgi:hypothetical protein